MKTKPHYALLGGGRLAQHLRRYLELEGLECSGWARDLRSELNTHNDPDPERRLRETLASATHVLLLVDDDAISTLLRKYPFLHQYRLIHCAGALSLPGVAGAHPLMTFGRTLYDQETYRAVPFMVEAGHEFDELLPGLSNPHYVIAPEQKALYHALCVILGNFPQILWQAASGRMDAELGIPPGALRAYLQQSLDNFLADPEGALTGPLARGDVATQARNKAALGSSPLQDLYRAFAEFHEGECHTESRQTAS
jgi:predicted short-subunit dehydrogenase-like oxidoreductase (DUF2520 family)